jgi:hypothetical protein
MKKIICIIFAVLVLAPIMAQAEFQVPRGVKTVEAPACITAPVESVSASFSLKDVTKAVKQGIGSVNTTVINKLNDWRTNDVAQRTAENAAIQGQYFSLKGEVSGINGNIVALDRKLTNTKDGEFKKLNDSVWSAGKELNKSVNSDLKWIAFWVILAVVLVGVGVAFFLKKSLNRIEDKVDEVDVKIDDIPTNMVNAFDRSPLNVAVSGHNVVFLQDEETLNRRVYQILLVEDDVDPTVTAADYELQVRGDRKKAEDSLRRTMREHFNGKLAAKTDAASLLTVKLIAYYKGTGKLSI